MSFFPSSIKVTKVRKARIEEAVKARVEEAVKARIEEAGKARIEVEVKAIKAEAAFKIKTCLRRKKNFYTRT